MRPRSSTDAKVRIQAAIQEKIRRGTNGKGPNNYRPASAASSSGQEDKENTNEDVLGLLKKALK